MDVALGKGEFYDVASLYSDELASSEMYYRLLNCGFRLAATGGTDNFPDVWRDPPPGTDRTYVKVDGPLTVASWLAGIKAGRTFGTTGPIVEFTVDGQPMGSELRLPAGGPGTVRVHAVVSSIAPVGEMQIVVNGKAVSGVVAGAGATRATVDKDVSIPDGGWIAVRVVGPASKYIADSYSFAQTTPVYVVRDGKPFVSKEDAKFLVEVVNGIWERSGRGPWRSEAERVAFKREIDQARAVYVKLGTD